MCVASVEHCTTHKQPMYTLLKKVLAQPPYAFRCPACYQNCG